MNFNIPNALTLCRIGLLPVLVLVFYFPEFENKHVVLASLFFFIGVTDLLDGYLARKLNQQSKFGAFLDPVADKLSVSIALVLIVSAHPGALVAVPAAVIIGRELTISALREWMANIGHNSEVKVSLAGKIKTAGQWVKSKQQDNYGQSALCCMSNPLAGSHRCNLAIYCSIFQPH